jgi:hypothetical protein
MTTGTVSHGANVEGWFVMVKDRHERFPNKALWVMVGFCSDQAANRKR